MLKFLKNAFLVLALAHATDVARTTEKHKEIKTYKLKDPEKIQIAEKTEELAREINEKNKIIKQ